MILQKQSGKFCESNTDSFVTTKHLARILDNYDEFKEDLIKIFNLDLQKTEVLKIGNAKALLESIEYLDSLCKKIDIISKIKNIQLKKIFDDEKALFEIFAIEDNFICSKHGSDILIVETRYSAKADLLDYYNFSKFANYCRDHEYEDLINIIKDYLKTKNSNNNEPLKLRLIYKNDDDNFYLRAITSDQTYKNFGINFSVFVALISLSKYIEHSKNEVFIDTYVVDDSNVYISFTLNQESKINQELSLLFSLILENNEIKRGAVSFNGLFKLKYKKGNKSSEIYLKPKKLVEEDYRPVDLLTYPHKGSVDKVFEKIEELPDLINHFITQVEKDAPKIVNIKNPNDVKDFIKRKVRQSRKQEFSAYKERIQEKLQSITVDNIFRLFELLREVEELFEHDDVISRDFWREKLYDALIRKE